MFEQELAVFREIQGKLLSDCPSGGYVVIKGTEVLGTWNDRQDALKEGIAKYGNVPFLVRDIRESLDDINNVINFSRDIQFA